MENKALSFQLRNRSNQLIWLYKQHIFYESDTSQGQYNLKDIKEEFKKRNVEYFKKHFFKYFVIRLDGRSRFQSVQPQPFAIFRTSRTGRNYLTRLSLNDENQRTLGGIIYDGLGLAADALIFYIL